ncbi:hypothetical protein Rt10032_c01g0422 [Rhodotorula toruloides]|uniref:Uncharacterized protein n=1 Tax=Rhodotorula toruloides TaxID=5286 RepID=A0A511K8S1_RHOTO|nr:hypothetical protein Rt10032_c01g0422 [Rhodotorula toruloides]
MALQAEQITVGLFLDGSRVMPFASATLAGGAVEANFTAELAPGMRWDLTWYSTRQDLIGSYGSVLRFEGSMEGSLVGGKVLGADGTGHIRGLLAIPPTTPVATTTPATPSSATRNLISPAQSPRSIAPARERLEELENELESTKAKADRFERSLLALYEIVPPESRLAYIDWRLRNDQLTPETRVKIATSKARVVKELETSAGDNAKAELSDMLTFCMHLEHEGKA